MKNMNDSKNRINPENGMVKRVLGETLVFTLVMLIATKLFGCNESVLCPVTIVTIIAAVMIGFTVIITALKEVIDK